MEQAEPQPVSQAVTRFFEARRQDRRASIDDVLRVGAEGSVPGELRTVVLHEIARQVRAAAASSNSSENTGAAADHVAPADEFPELEGYDIVDLLGRGGMGVVYEAYQQSTGRRVALKFMLTAAPSDATRRRFEREVELVARLQHPHIVPVLDAGIHRGRYYYVMDYVDGRPLDQAQPPGACDPRQTLALVATVAEAVDYAHQRGVLHRDLKPSNVLVDERGSVRLLDFGLAKAIDPVSRAGAEQTLSEPGQLVGTLAYMSPEQSRGDLAHLSVRSDVYALGAMAYELLTGRLPCGIDGPLLDVLDRLARRDPARPSALRRTLNADVDAILLKALEKSSDRRYATAADFAADIRRFLADRPITARRAGPGQRLVRWARRNRAVAAVGGLAALALLVFAAVWFVQWRADRDRDERVQHFFTRNFGFATPDVAKRATIERRDLYDYAASRVDAELAGYPLAQADVRHALGLSYLELALYPEAQQQLSAALEIRRRHLGDDQPDTAETMHALAHVLHQQNEYAAAQRLYEQALRVRQKTFGQRSPQAAETLNNLGWLAKDRGNYAEAEARYRAALDLRRTLHGPDHPAVAETLNDLAHLYYTMQQYAAAEQHFRDALAIRLRLYPDQRNTHVAATMASLGSVLNKLGRYDEAGPLLADALAIRETLCGPRHADTLVSRNEWGLHLLETGRHEAAAEALRENLNLRTEVYGPRHRLVAVSMINLALALQAQGDFSTAQRLLRDAHAILIELYGVGKDHQDIAAVLNHLAAVLCDLGQYDEAYELAAQVYELRLRLTHGRENAAVGQALCTRGRTRLARGDAGGARDDLARAVELLTTDLPVAHWRVALARSLLGECLVQLGEFEQAEPLLAESYAHIKAVQGAQSRYTEAARQRLIALYEAWGRPQDADRYRPAP